MAQANPRQHPIPDAERYQHEDTLVTAEAKAWLSEFQTEVEVSRRLQNRALGKDKAIGAPVRAQRRIAPWEVLASATKTNRKADKPARNRLDIDVIRSALGANRTEFYLQPVVSLADRKVHFYEGLTRLRDEQGQIIMPATYLPLATQAGLTPVIDNLLLMRSIKVLESFKKRKYDIGVFCNFSKHALQNLNDFAPFRAFIENHQDLSKSLIFEFSQEILYALDEKELKILAHLAKLGFRFSLDNINALDINFQKLFLLGFRYLKVDSNILLKGEDRSGMNFVTITLAEQMRRFGLQLIAQKLETKTMATDLFNYDIRLGQGYLFGKPRLIRPPARQPRQKRAATG